jgi:hypothetical protein
VIAALLGRPIVRVSAFVREATGVKQAGPGWFEWLGRKGVFPHSILFFSFSICIFFIPTKPKLLYAYKTVATT